MTSFDRSSVLVPDGLPVLRWGSHRDPRQGACLMEYVSALAGEDWSDRPCCTDPDLAVLAQLVNDRVSRDARRHLALLATDLVGATGTGVADVLVRDCAEAGLTVRPGHRGLRRRARRAQARLDRGGGWFRRRARLLGAYRRLLGVLLAVPDERRDAVLVGLLERAVRDVRAQQGRPDAQPASSSTPVGSTPVVVAP